MTIPDRNFLNTFFIKLSQNCDDCYNEKGSNKTYEGVRSELRYLLESYHTGEQLIGNKEFTNKALDICNKCNRQNFQSPGIKNLVIEALKA